MLPVIIIPLLALMTSSCVNAMHVVTIGDFGDNSVNGIARQERMAQTLSEWCGVERCDFIVDTGDNFYNDGVFTPTDERFNTSWRWVYDKPHIRDLMWYISLGNHDYGTLDDRELNQVEFGRTEPRWYLPWIWYDFYRIEDNLSVHFIFVDAMSIQLRKHDWEAQMAWLESTLANSIGTWKILINHHPPYSAGGYAPGSTVHRNTLVPLAEKYAVDLFITGHDHNVQHIVKRGTPDVDYVISGGGGRGLYAFSASGNSTLSGMGYDLQYFGHYNGFVMLDVARERIVVDYIDTTGNLNYSFTRSKQ